MNETTGLSSFTDYRLPQRFQYKRDDNHPWRNGVAFPSVGGSWCIRVGNGFGDFYDDPWEVMGHIIGDAACFRWIDNDYGWHPHGGMCCDTTYQTCDDLLNHLRTVHA